MTCRAVILLEKFISLELLCCKSRIITIEPLVESRTRSYESALELLDRISNVLLCQTIRIYCSESSSKLIVSLKLLNDLVERL